MGYPNNQLSNPVSHFMQPLLETLPLYIQDRKHFSRYFTQLSEFYPLSNNTYQILFQLGSKEPLNIISYKSIGYSTLSHQETEHANSNSDLFQKVILNIPPMSLPSYSFLPLSNFALAN